MSAANPVRGSPPLMRGTGKPFIFRCFALRITPAHAGNRNKGVYQMELKKDHPRSCGEQSAYTYNALQPQGSPPLMRGTGYKFWYLRFGGGITPAHAGNSAFSIPFLGVRKDHPRSCGEQAPKVVFAQCAWGSPPLMRGTALLIGGRINGKGITPAHAGNRLL